MTPDQAADLAARTFAAIDALFMAQTTAQIVAADRERVASDLEVLRICAAPGDVGCDNALTAIERIAEANLRRTADLYGVTE
jgi:hypothetical protein